MAHPGRWHHDRVATAITRRSFLAIGAAAFLGCGAAVNDGPGPVPNAPPGDERVEQRHSDVRNRGVAFYTAVPADHGDGRGLPGCLIPHGASAPPADHPRLGLREVLTDRL